MSDPLVILFRTARAAMAAMLLVAACALGGCANNGAASDSFAMAGGSGPTVAFETIDGPPPQVFDRMVSVAAISRRRSCAARP